VGGIIGTTLGLVEAEQAWQAEAQRATSEAHERRRAEKEQAIAVAVRNFLQNGIFRQASSKFQADRHFIPNPNLTVRDAVDRAAQEVANRFQTEPLVEAGIRSALGDAYTAVGEFDKAIAQLERAVELCQAHQGQDDPSTLLVMNDLAWAYYLAWKLPEAIAL